MKNLFDAVEMKNLHLKNRLIRSATWEGIAEYDGSIDENTYKIYHELAKGEVGENELSADEVKDIIKMFVDAAIHFA